MIFLFSCGFEALGLDRQKGDADLAVVISTVYLDNGRFRAYEERSAGGQAWR